MLKITNSATVHEERWILCGQLAGPWVPELRSNWNEVRGWSRGRQYVIDLSDVTFIDDRGEGLLRELRDEGAEFVARGVDTKHLLENLNSKEEPTLRRFLTRLTEGCDQH
jgi:anti-anti-sigma regulatory factor